MEGIKIFLETKPDCGYNILVTPQDNTLYRKELGSIGTWRLYGGATPNVDFGTFQDEEYSGSPFARVNGEVILGIGKYLGKKLTETAQEVQVGHQLIAQPLDSPRARELNIVGTSVLTGIVKKITTPFELNENFKDNLEELLR